MTQSAPETESTQHQERIEALPFVENRATAESAQTLRDELLYLRATLTCLWALPLINTLGMQRGSEQTLGAGYNSLPAWKKRLDARTLVTTPNADVMKERLDKGPPRCGPGFPAHCASRDSFLSTQNTVQEMMS